MHWGSPGDPLKLYSKHYKLFAKCRRPYCENRQELHVTLLLIIFEGETTLGNIGARFRCTSCQPPRGDDRITVRRADEGWAVV